MLTNSACQTSPRLESPRRARRGGSAARGTRVARFQIVEATSARHGLGDDQYTVRMAKQFDPKTVKSWSDDKLIDYWVNVLEQEYEPVGTDELESARALAEPYRDAYLSWVVWMEVANGGFDQLLSNRGEQLVGLAAESLERLGCAQSADLVRRMIDAHRSSGDQIELTTDDGSDPCETIESEFYEKWPDFVREKASAFDPR